MLGRTERESPAHAALAARIGGWAVEDTLELLDLGTTTGTLATVASIDDLGAVMHLGHPEQPWPELEEALLQSASSLIVTSAVAVPGEWVWVGPASGGPVGGQVIVDEAGMRDCRSVLRGLGVSPRLVPSRTTVDERVALAGPDGSLVIERSRVPAGYAELPDSAALQGRPPVWYGLLESRHAWPVFDEPAQVWLAFGPYDDHRGSLQPTLAVIAGTGIDLQHLRSHQSVLGPHVFFTSFSCPSSAVLDALVAELDQHGVAHRTLAVLPGADFVPGPLSLDPQWAPAGGDGRARS
ncbi:hypothetical protein [Antribacter gilvus]|uniref:hypothetical protein n=1 Tax=Antribacter gilvus TaxID=2304675 RepID=UPI000F777E77|nr:hypothetical protein [Antribacter gilvus]